MELGKGETPQGDRTEPAIHGGGWHTLVLFLGLRVAVTGACFLHLGDPYEAADSYGGCGENKGEKKEWSEWGQKFKSTLGLRQFHKLWNATHFFPSGKVKEPPPPGQSLRGRNCVFHSKRGRYCRVYLPMMRKMIKPMMRRGEPLTTTPQAKLMRGESSRVAQNRKFSSVHSLRGGIIVGPGNLPSLL